MITEYSESYSSKALFKFFIGLFILVAIIIYNIGFVNDVYFKDQKTSTGIIINGMIVLLFVIGLFKMIRTLLFYRAQENAISDFVENLNANSSAPTAGVVEESFIVERYIQLTHLYATRTPINHGALASMLVAKESTRTNTTKYINNILILMGVFGTIVSLSIALLGASNLLKAEDLDAMNLVIHGMSTAMSTTITAIVTYLLYGYFYMLLTDVQTKVISALEMITTTRLMPKFNRQMDTIVKDVADLVFALREVATNMQRSQRNNAQLEQRLGDLVQHHDTHLSKIAKDIHSVTGLLKKGFRLPDNDNS